MKAKTFLALVRIPTVFSSMSNAYAGYFIAGGRDFSLALLMGILAAALFIMAGMGEAWAMSLGMMAAGLALLVFANPLSALVGAALCLAIFAYNFALKATLVGPASMGLCRLLNLLTGMSLAWERWPDWASLPLPVTGALVSLWAYIALVTYLARDEVQGNSRTKARLFLSGITVWFAAWSAAIWMGGGPGQGITLIMLAVVWLGHILFLLGPFRNLARDPSPRNTGRTVGAMLRTVPMADVLAMLAADAPLVAALPGLLWILPAWLAGRLFYTT